ncbi:MAG: ATP-binding protein [Nitrospirota bacterium]
MGRAEDIFKKIINDGETGINEFILTRKSEELFLDFKRSTDNGSGRLLHQNDRENLARAISGFGNSEGGIIIWGVDCSKDKDHADVAHTKFPIQDVKRFVSWLEGAVSGCTVPPHTGVQHYYIITNNEDGSGFVITYIPKSNHAPHQVVITGKGQYHYYIRAGSNFVLTPHAVLAGMFGRRPQPHVFHMFAVTSAELIMEQFKKKIKITVGFMIGSQGPGIASDLFMNAMAISTPGDNCDLWFEVPNPDDWTGRFSFGRQISLISKPDIRLPPESQIQPFIMFLQLAPPFSRDLIIDGICGCGQSPPYKFRIEKDNITIEKLYNNFMEKNKEGLLIEEEKINFVKDLLNIKKEKLPE